MALNTVLDQPTMSNLTSLSEEASFSSGNGVSMLSAISHQQQSIKRKRKLPGNPDPNAEVIALSPRALMATNRFLCEICNKGFQRDQNLQLHRRAHNLPWKLKQRSSKEMKKRVFICPEPSCVHHDPSRALGDLTGIKKHFFRKHGEKKWKCEKCSKRYAVQTDWKAHSKTCGTREYRCDCGTLFSRKDSFITHRAFCDALAQETARLSSPSNPLLQNPNPFSFPPNPILQQTHFPNISQLSSSLSLSQNPYHSQETKPSIPLFLNPKPSISSYFSTQVPKSPFLSNFTNQAQAQPTTTPHISATASTDHVPQMCHQTHLEIDHQFAEVGHMVSAGISPEMEPESSFPAMQELLNSRFGLFLNQREKNQHHQSTRDFLGIGDDPNMSMRELLSFSGVDLDYESNQRLKPDVISNFHCSTATDTWGNC